MRSTIGAFLVVLVTMGTLVTTEQPARSAFSGTNGKIAFESSRDGNVEIYVMDPDGANQTNITNNATKDADPTWSPSGTEIAFVRFGPHPDIWTMNADGSDAQNLTPGPPDGEGNGGTHPTWSPDGDKIAYADNGEIWVIDLVTLEKTNISSTPSGTGVESMPAWSPDGTRIAYSRTLDLWVMNADGTGQTLLVHNPRQADRAPDWYPDSSKIVFESSGRIWVVDADGGNPIAVAAGPGKGGVHPSFSPDGLQIAFSSNGYGAQNYDIIVMNADGTGGHRLHADPNKPDRTDTNPSWQPVVSLADLGITMTDAPDPLPEGEQVTYSMQVTNDGPATATRARITDTLPARSTFVSAEGPRGSCTKVKVTVTCPLGDLEPGQSASAHLIVSSSSALPIANTAQVSSLVADPRRRNNYATETTDLAPPPPNADLQADLQWAVGDRLKDYNGDGIIDEKLPRDLPPFDFTLIGCGSSGPIIEYEFEVTLKDGSGITHKSPNCRFTFQTATEGRYPTTLTVRSADGSSDSLEQVAVLKDFLLFSLGDSVGSGEGNPDEPCRPTCQNPGRQPEYWQDKRCHRSTISGPAGAAINIERRDPASSVTFVHLACSGGQITAGILKPYDGIVPPPGAPPLAPQANAMERIIQQLGRKPDAVMISVGANDARFASILTRCLEPDRCWRDRTFVGDVNGWMEDLPRRFRLLDARLDDIGIPGKKVFITEYFDPTMDERGRFADCLPTLYPSELEWAHFKVMGPLNRHVREAAKLKGHDWNYVGGIADAFLPHGYCAFIPWIVHLGESLTFQGDLNGSFHPDNQGQQFYSRRLFDVIRPTL